MPGYRLEVSKTRTAGCVGRPPCKGTKIQKGELRIGTWVEIMGRGSFKWRHWGCTTEKIIDNLKDSFDTADEIDGFEELPEVFQDKVTTAFKEGHIDDADIPESAQIPPTVDDEGQPPASQTSPTKAKRKAESKVKAEAKGTTKSTSSKKSKKKKVTMIESESESDIKSETDSESEASLSDSSEDKREKGRKTKPRKKSKFAAASDESDSDQPKKKRSKVPERETKPKRAAAARARAKPIVESGTESESN